MTTEPPKAPPPGSWTGGVVGVHAECVLAPNPSPMTLEGTNTWVLSAPGSAEAIVIDPGPEHEGHLCSVVEAVQRRGARVAVALLTHGHLDHSEGVERFAELAGCPVRALDPQHRLGDEGLVGGDVVTAGDLELRVVSTPGHTSDSLSFLLPSESAVLTGDTILGRGTTVVAHPDGRLAPYLESLRTLRSLVETAGATRVLPGHGPVVDDAAAIIDYYLVHRAERLDQVRAALAAGARTPQDVLEIVYADVDRAVWPHAERSVRAQLDYLGGV